MPEVVRGSRAGEADSPASPSSRRRSSRHFGRPSIDHTVSETAIDDSAVAPDADAPNPAVSSAPPTPATEPDLSSPQRHVAFQNVAEQDHEPSPAPPLARDRRRSSSFFRRESHHHHDDRAEADVYYDSRAATKREFRRRPTTLEDYYKSNPDLLPQLPFTWHRGKKRFRLGFLIALMWIDACVLPIVFYYAFYYAGHIENWITFAIITTVWGGPTYLEFALRTLKLMKKERFYRPLGTNSRWCFDLVTWASVLTITAVTALFIVGSAPHIVWLRVLSMPGPAILYCLGGVVGLLTLYHSRGWKAPFRISSTGKGETVKPGVYYFIEDVVAVNANAGRPYREALNARYEASPRFRAMLYHQSIFWSVPALILAIPLTVIACVHSVSATVAYGICWAVPFIWATIWAGISVWWAKKEMVRERKEWEMDKLPVKKHELEEEKSPSPNPDNNDNNV